MEPYNKNSNAYYGNNTYKKSNYRGQGYNKSYGTGYSNDSNYNYESYGKRYDKTTKHSNNYRKEVVDPYMAQAMLQRAEMYILTKYPNLIDINSKNEKLSSNINESSQFFIIKSFSEEDVHKAIKYGVWSSTKTGNQTLSNAFKLSQEKGGSVYLIFSTNGSGRYSGVARMKSPCDDEKSFIYWTQDGKWPGLFDIEWLLIKDVPFKNFKNIYITMKDGLHKPISNARDTQEVPFEQGKFLIEIIESYQNTNTILEHFEYYDLRQENYDKHYNPQ